MELTTGRAAVPPCDQVDVIGSPSSSSCERKLRSDAAGCDATLVDWDKTLAGPGLNGIARAESLLSGLVATFADTCVERASEMEVVTAASGVFVEDGVGAGMGGAVISEEEVLRAR